MGLTLRQRSKADYSPNGENSYELINAGSLQRIADATELMASKYIQMEKDLKWYKEMYAKHSDKISHFEKSNAALKGHITRLKKRLKIPNVSSIKYNSQSENVKQK